MIYRIYTAMPIASHACTNKLHIINVHCKVKTNKSPRSKTIRVQTIIKGRMRSIRPTLINEEYRSLEPAYNPYLALGKYVAQDPVTGVPHHFLFKLSAVNNANLHGCRYACM